MGGGGRAICLVWIRPTLRMGLEVRRRRRRRGKGICDDHYYYYYYYY